MYTFTFERDIKNGLLELKVFNKDNFNYELFKDMDPEIQDQFIATIKHIDNIMYEEGVKMGDIKGLMMQMNPDDWESRWETAPIMSINRENKISIDALNRLIREKYIFFPKYLDTPQKGMYTSEDYKAEGMEIIYQDQ